jgi:PAS domain S-box-containing protein
MLKHSKNFNRFKSNNALTSKLLPLGVAVLLLIAFLSIYLTEISLKQSVKKQLVTSINFTASQLLEWQNILKSYVLSIAKHEELSDLVEQILIPSLNDEEVELLKRKIVNELHIGSYFKGYRGFYLSSMDDQVIVKNLDILRTPLEDFRNSSYKQQLSQQQTVISHVFTSNLSSKNNNTLLSSYFWIGAPIANKLGKQIGNLFFLISFDLETEKLFVSSRYGNSGETYVFNSNLQMLSTSRFQDNSDIASKVISKNPDGTKSIYIRDPKVNLMEDSLSDLDRDSQPPTLMALNAIDKKSGVNIDGYRDYRGVFVVGAWQWIDDFDIGIVTEIDYAEIFKTKSTVLNWMFVLIGVLLFFVTLLFIFNKKALKTEEQLNNLKLALDGHAIVSIADSDGKIQYANRKFEEISKYSKEELLGKDHNIINSGYHSKEFFKDMWDTILTGQVWHGELKNRSKDGTFYWVATTILPIVDNDKKPKEYISIRTDITTQKEIQMELALSKQKAEKNAKLKSIFLSNMSHEIRSPLTAVIGYAEELSLGSLSSEDSKLAVDSIVRNGEHLLSVINDILDISKLESGYMTLESAHVELDKLLLDISTISQQQASKKQIELVIEKSTNCPTVIISDQTRLKQILINLLSNAIKFTSENGKVSLIVDYDKDANELNFAVTDTGIGLTDEQQVKLFKAFSQADTTTTRKFGGTGLGLVISSQLAKLLNGKIEVLSVVNQGSTFTLKLNCVDKIVDKFINIVDSQTKKSSRVISNVSLINGKILLVDDSKDNQYLIAMILRKLGLYVDTCGDGSAAIQAVSEHEYDLVIMDIEMPVMDGLTAVQILRNQGVDYPIIALSANILKEDIDKAIRAGFSNYISKPINRSEFIETIKNYLSS